MDGLSELVFPLTIYFEFFDVKSYGEIPELFMKDLSALVRVDMYPDISGRVVHEYCYCTVFFRTKKKEFREMKSTTLDSIVANCSQKPTIA